MARKTKEEAMETRDRLMESALEVMSEKPFSKVSMAEIAERIGLSKGAVYWHFKNKFDLLINLVDDVCSKTRDELLDMSGDNAEVRANLRRYFKNKMTHTAHDKRVHKIHVLMQRSLEWPDDLRDKVASVLIERAAGERKMIEELIARAQSEGRVRSDMSAEELSMLISALFHGLMVFQLHRFYPVDFSNYTDFLFDALDKQLSPDAVLKPFVREANANKYKEKVLNV